MKYGHDTQYARDGLFACFMPDQYRSCKRAYRSADKRPADQYALGNAAFPSLGGDFVDHHENKCQTIGNDQPEEKPKHPVPYAVKASIAPWRI